MNEDEMARALTQGLHQYREDRRAEERRLYIKRGLVSIGALLIFCLAVLGSFGKLG
ncbi:hypothetical protein PV332_05275 [Streptomyces scabiei]|uniref:hypothetical protein n=1 Tax=Streptomyces TaxID=1883 RepID=UPI001314BD9E|nr:hypothetical protein [Streptomyces scabiei]MDX2574900.1 hypothetical protein [Streptomyces scabiei]MDX2650820.1 hypothetical protein [Streptomyces scabiei]MDX2719838.1 hypothetical protein [Streptomyces scabiei]MDX2868854.1 hypothetical protein [Streptomyces scabiei]MDX2886028.1 hypothetical protein [Streptomyces scabiei]